MGIISNLFGRSEKRSASREEILSMIGQSIGSESVDGNGSLKVTAFYSGVDLISGTLASLPWEIYQKDPKSGNRQIATNHQLFRVLNSEPNKVMSSFWLRKLLFTWALVRGDGYAQIIRNEDTDPVGLIFWPADKVRTYKKGDDIWHGIQGFSMAVPDEDMIHVMPFSLNGYEGVNPVAYHRTVFESSLYSQKFNLGFYKNGGWFKGILKRSRPIDDGDRAEIRASWLKQTGGPENLGGVPILGNGLEFESVNLPQKDAQYIESQGFTIIQVAQILHLPPFLLASMQGTQYNNVEQQNIAFVQNCLRIWVKQFEQEVNRKLFSEAEKRQGYYSRINLDGLLRGDLNTRRIYYQAAIQYGWMTRNEVRAMENLNRYDSDLMDDPLTPLSTAPLGTTELEQDLQEEELKQKKKQKEMQP